MGSTAALCLLHASLLPRSTVDAPLPMRRAHTTALNATHTAMRAARGMHAAASRRSLSSAASSSRAGGSLGSVCAILGAQWGDEGKGKLVDILAQK